LDLEVTVEAQGASTIAHVRGEIDAYTAPALREVLHELADTGHSDVVVHLREVPFVDSSALGVLIGSLKRQRAAGGTLRLAALEERVLRVFRLTGLDTVFEIHPDIDAALATGQEN
jgi:anti-sigma B factor antagonist